MKLLTILFSVFFIVSCNVTKQRIEADVNVDGNLIGIAQKIDFQKTPFKEWFVPNYEEYAPDMTIVKQLKPLMKDIQIKAVMGTWCGDSRRETPHFYKLMDAIDFDYKNLIMITVDRDKMTPNNDTDSLNIERVPTFIFYKNGKEINRFVEYPRETLEKDFLKILQETGYKHSYLD